MNAIDAARGGVRERLHPGLFAVHKEEFPMPDPDKPNPKRLGRAAIVIGGIVILMAVAIFVGLNLQHATEVDENPASAPTQAN